MAATLRANCCRESFSPQAATRRPAGRARGKTSRAAGNAADAEESDEDSVEGQLVDDATAVSRYSPRLEMLTPLMQLLSIS